MNSGQTEIVSEVRQEGWEGGGYSRQYLEQFFACKDGLVSVHDDLSFSPPHTHASDRIITSESIGRHSSNRPDEEVSICSHQLVLEEHPLRGVI
jgi:hypothetical protein